MSKLYLFYLLLLLEFGFCFGLNWFQHSAEEQDDSLLKKAKDTATKAKETIQDTASSVKESLKETGKRAASSSLFYPYNTFADWWDNPSKMWPHAVANWGQFRSFPNEYVIYLDVPGIPKEELEVRIKGRRLRVRGTHGTCVAGGSEIDRYCLERQVERSFSLPDDVVIDHVDALLKDGMLMIKLPRLQDETSESEEDFTTGSTIMGRKLRGKRVGVKDYRPTWRERAKEATEAVQHALHRNK